MGDNEELIKDTSIQEIADKGGKIYEEELKEKYESESNDKFLAIEVESKKAYLGDSTAEAVEKARSAHPNKIFYVVKIGSSASEVLAGLEVGI